MRVLWFKLVPDKMLDSDVGLALDSLLHKRVSAQSCTAAPYNASNVNIVIGLFFVGMRRG